MWVLAVVMVPKLVSDPNEPTCACDWVMKARCRR